MCGHEHDGKDEKYIQNLVWKPEEKRPFGILRCTWEDNIRINLREIVWENVECIYLVNTVMKLQVSQKAGNFLNS
jgi:hypothetical protein